MGDAAAEGRYQRIDKNDAVIKDATGSIPLKLWESTFKQVTSGQSVRLTKVSLFKNFQIGPKVLNTWGLQW